MAEWAATFGAKFEESKTMTATFRDSSEMDAEFGEVQKIATSDYNDLFHKPQINGVELIGNKTSREIFVQDLMDEITEQDIDQIIYGGA